MTTKFYLSLLTLSPIDLAWNRVTDPYSLHRIICGLFGLGGVEKKGSAPSGIQWRFAEGHRDQTRVLILSKVPPSTPMFGNLETKELPDGFLDSRYYRFYVRVNPSIFHHVSRNVEPVRGDENIIQWFADRAPRWGFSVDPGAVEVTSKKVVTFRKDNRKVTLSQADLRGTLEVTDKDIFSESFANGIGRGRAFGCGLLQIIPVSLSTEA